MTINNTTIDIMHTLSDVSADVLGVFGVVVLFVALGLAKGKDVLLVLLFSLYPALLITSYFPFYDALVIGGGDISVAFEKLVVFVFSAVVVIVIMRGYINSGYQGSSFWRTVEVFVLSVMSVGLFISALYHVVHIEELYNFSFVFDTLFAPAGAFFVWLILPLLSIPMFIRA